MRMRFNDVVLEKRSKYFFTASRIYGTVLRNDKFIDRTENGFTAAINLADFATLPRNSQQKRKERIWVLIHLSTGLSMTS